MQYTQKIKSVFFIISIFSFFSAYGQNAQKKIAMQLFQENILILERGSIKNDISFLNKIELKIDTLATSSLGCVILEFSIRSNCVKKFDDSLHVYFNASSCNKFTIALDKKSDMLYRIRGFNGNDLLFLLRDISQNLPAKESEIEILKELDNLNSSIGFLKIYKAMKKREYDSEYLLPCSSPIISHIGG